MCSMLTDLLTYFCYVENLTKKKKVVESIFYGCPTKSIFLQCAMHYYEVLMFLNCISDVPEAILDFEAKVRDGLGENGRSVSLSKEQTEDDIKDQMKHHSFNKYVSDVISLKRNLPDTRHHSCRELDYELPENLPTASVILIFSNEALSAVLRTVWSLILRSPKVSNVYFATFL